ncbi:MAG: PKD domain-containing protein [Pseudomonadota bacterium]
MKHLSTIFLIFSLIFLLFACEGNVEQDENEQIATGNAKLVIHNNDIEDIDYYEVVIEGDDMTTINSSFEMADDVSGYVYNIPAGTDRTFTLNAYNVDSILIFTGSALANVLEGETVEVEITLNDVNPEAESVGNAHIVGSINYLPRIDVATATDNDVNIAETITLTVEASDPDADTLSYLWTATGGSFSDDAAETTVWTAPLSFGTYTITITVDDGNDGEASLDIEITVN